MTEDLKEIKKKITSDWISAFPQLSSLTQNKLYKIVGCCILGIELIKLPNVDNYRPHFVIYPLWRKDLKSCLDHPIIVVEIYNKKGLQFSIPYIKHADYFHEVKECFKQQIGVSIDGNVTLKSLFELIDNRFNDILVKSNSAQQAKLFELKFYIALFIGDYDQAQGVLNQINEKSKIWNMQMFQIWYGEFDLWLKDFEEKMDNRDEFLKQIMINKHNKKMDKLKNSELVL